MFTIKIYKLERERVHLYIYTIHSNEVYEVHILTKTHFDRFVQYVNQMN